MAKSWSSQETSYLKRYAATKTLGELAERFEVEADEVRNQLTELNLTTKDGEPKAGSAVQSDPLLGSFEKGLKALYKERWDQAVKLFEKVVEEADQSELVARAQQHLEIARRRAGEDAAGVDDPYLKAVVEKNRGAYDAAWKIVKAQKKDDGGRFAYLAACLHALAEDPEAAAEALGKAVGADPRHRVHAFLDPDLAALRKQKDYAHLFGLD
jgi:tetratricopeptide (TPR) repeat protein